MNETKFEPFLTEKSGSHDVSLVASVVQLYSCSTVVVSTIACAEIGVSNTELRLIVNSCVVSITFEVVVWGDDVVDVVVCEIGTHGHGMRGVVALGVVVVVVVAVVVLLRFEWGLTQGQGDLGLDDGTEGLDNVVVVSVLDSIVGANVVVIVVGTSVTTLIDGISVFKSIFISFSVFVICNLFTRMTSI